MRAPRIATPALVGLLGMFVPASAHAEEGVCHIVGLKFQPAELSTSTAPMRAPSQMVAWIEDPAGNYVDTIYITEATGTYGLGNRPGRFDFNSGPNWPYGRRVNVFPIWAHKRAASGAMMFPELVFQNGDDSNLSHPFNQSSKETKFCRPLQREEVQWDTASCASAVYTDKGVFGGKMSAYPPRNDVARLAPDHPSVDMFAMMNPFDAVSQPTPPAGAPAEVTWIAPETVPFGDYVLWVEVSREFDHNATYSATARPAPTGIPWGEYGEPYRGQPSIVYQLPFTLDEAGGRVAFALDYAGYGDPDGAAGTVHPPDGTITSGVAGSGAERLALLVEGSTSYRLRLGTRTEIDAVEPAAPQAVAINTLTPTSAILEFTAPGDDALAGQVIGYEVRYVAGPALDDAGFETAQPISPRLVLGPAGTVHELELTGLLYDTEYTVGVRAIDDCRNRGPIAYVTFRTPERPVGEVDACFVATAAYGSVLANDVEMLRRVRDVVLQKTVLGELAVEAYYTFGPAVAGVVGESELLRASARAVLDPIVATVRVFRF